MTRRFRITAVLAFLAMLLPAVAISQTAAPTPGQVGPVAGETSPVAGETPPTAGETPPVPGQTPPVTAPTTPTAPVGASPETAPAITTPEGPTTPAPAGGIPAPEGGLTVATGAFGVPPGAPCVPPCITLQDAINTALANNPQIMIALQTVERSKGVVSEAYARGRVSLTGSAVYTVQGPPQTVEFTTLPGQPPVTVDLVNTTNFITRATATQPVDVSGRIRYAEEIASLNERTQVYNLVRSRNDIALNVKLAYYNVLRAYGQQYTAQSAVTVAQEQLRIARVQYEAGTAARYDVTQAEVRVKNLEQTLISAKNNITLQKATLNTTIGRPANEPVEVQLRLSNICSPLETAALLPVAYANRPEIKAAQTQVTLQDKNITYVRRQLWPQVALTADGNYSPQSTGFATAKFTWDVNAALTVPIFDGGVTKAQVKQAKADRNIAVSNLDQTKLNVSSDVQTAVTNIGDAIERISSTRANVALAEEGLRLARIRYEAQVGTIVDVQTAENQLIVANNNLVNARYDYEVALAQLQRAIASDEVLTVAPEAPTVPELPPPVQPGGPPAAPSAPAPGS